MTLHLPQSMPGVNAVDLADRYRFRSVIASTFSGAQVDSMGLGFHASMRSSSLHGVVVSRVTAGAHRTVRAHPSADLPGGDAYMLAIQLAGTGTIQQADRTISLEPGEMTAYDMTKPYTLEFAADFDSVGVTVPRQAIALSPLAMGAVMMSTISAGDPIGSSVSDLACRLVADDAIVDQIVRDRLFGNLVDLTETLWLARIRAGEQSAFDAPRSLPVDLLRYIEANLSDPALSPASVAAAHFMSVRKLHGLFGREGLTIASWIRRRRLERCRDDLSRIELQSLTIAEIAARWGYVNPPHFSQLFRNAFGMTATAYRMHAVEPR